MYESKETGDQAVEYSYSQYHWWATTLTVTDGDVISSIKYKM